MEDRKTHKTSKRKNQRYWTINRFWPGVHHIIVSKYSKGPFSISSLWKCNFSIRGHSPILSLIFSMILNPSLRLFMHSFFHVENEGKRKTCLTYLTDIQRISNKIMCRKSTQKSIKMLFKYEMWQILHPQEYMWIRMNLCLEEAAAVIIEMWGLIDGQSTWVAFQIWKGNCMVCNEKTWD